MKFVDLFNTLERILASGNATNGVSLIISTGDFLYFGDQTQYIHRLSATELELDGNGAFRLNDTQGYSAHQGTFTPASSTQTINWNSGNSATIDLGAASANVTLTLSNPKSGASYALEVIQGATARNIVWPAAVLWPNGGTDPVISTANDAKDVFVLFYNGTNYLSTFAQNLS